MTWQGGVSSSIYLVEWSLVRNGFVGSIRSCLESSTISVLVNGSSIRQGDSLTSFLFLVAARGINGLLKQAISSIGLMHLKCELKPHFMYRCYNSLMILGEGISSKCGAFEMHS